MIWLLLVFIAVDVAQAIYIRYLKKEICLRDGTYKPKKKKRFFGRKTRNEQRTDKNSSHSSYDS